MEPASEDGFRTVCLARRGYFEVVVILGIIESIVGVNLGTIVF
jgi:hypothetical protein